MSKELKGNFKDGLSAYRENETDVTIVKTTTTTTKQNKTKKLLKINQTYMCKTVCANMFEDIGKLTPYNTFNDRLLFQTMKMQKCTKMYTNKCRGNKVIRGGLR